MSYSRIIYLFDRYLNQSATEREVAEFYAYLNNPDYAKGIRVLLKDAFANQSEVDSLSEQQISTVLNNILEQQDEKPSGKKNGKLVYIMRAFAAAAIIFLAFGIYFFSHQLKPSKIVPAETAGNYVENPEKNEIVLTLTSGKHIVISEKKRGIIAEESGAQVVKMDDGTIVYNIKPQVKDNLASGLHTITVPRGKQCMVILSDGSKVSLNSCSALKYPLLFNTKERIVNLSGEGYFEVKKRRSAYYSPLTDHHIPFIVKSGKHEVFVLGTSFNVQAYEDDQVIKTTLLQGRIKISDHILKPGQQAIFSNGKIKLKEVNAKQAIAWKEGYFTFNNEDIYAVMRKISRWYDVEITYQGNFNKDGFSGVVFKFDDVSKVLEVLKETDGFHFKILEPTANQKERRIMVIP